jgi:excinuclease UvrABC nuclease subunit
MAEEVAMPIADNTYRTFSEENVNNAPDVPGVYALFVLNQSGGYGTIYYGRAKVSIRQRLQRHFNGDEGSCTQQAVVYKREVNSSPASREVQLLEEFQNNYGQLPRCNSRVG